MMEDVKAKRVNMVIVKDLSRFGRNYLQVGFYISDIFPQMNVRFIAIGNDVVLVLIVLTSPLPPLAPP